MKLNIEIDLDWIDEEGSIDEEIEHRLIKSLSDKLEHNFIKDASTKVALAADKLITAKTELLINTILEKPVKVSNGWNDNREYGSIYEMVESRMSAMYGEKLDNNGKCTKDPLLSQIESYVDGEITRHTEKMTDKARVIAEREAKKAIKENKTVQAIESLIVSKSA